MKELISRAIIPVGALAAIGGGLWFIYPPLAFVVVGLLVWIDLWIGGR